MRLTAAAQIALAQLTGDAVPHSAVRRPFDGQNEKLGEFIDMRTSVERSSRSEVRRNAGFSCQVNEVGYVVASAIAIEETRPHEAGHLMAAEAQRVRGGAPDVACCARDQDLHASSLMVARGINTSCYSQINWYLINFLSLEEKTKERDLCDLHV